MNIIVQHVERRWRVAHPQLPLVQEFERGAEAFDAAVALARTCHRQDGRPVAIRVEAFSTQVEALRIG